MTDRQPGAPGQYIFTVDPSEAQNILIGQPVPVTLVRDDQPVLEGTPYNKASVLPDEVAEKICPDVLDPTPADAFKGLISKKIEKIIPASGWSTSAPYTQEISVTKANSGIDITKDHTPHICLTPDEDVSIALGQEGAWGCVSRGITLDKKIRFICYEDKPEIDIPIQIEVRP